jgi:N-acetylmuramoyl-L-alanine amidase
MSGLPGREATRRALLGLLLLAAPLPVRGQGAAVTVGAQGRGARVAIRLPTGARWRLSAMDRPPRLVLDLGAATLPGPRAAPGQGLVRQVRLLTGPSRVVLDLTGPVAPPRAAVAGGVLTLDLAPGPAEAFRRLAASSRPLAEGGGPPQRPLVVLDPGHGGSDPGAIGVQGTQEKRIVLAAATELRRRLEQGGRVRVAMTRTRDRFVALADRVAFARDRGASLFISLHADSAPGARGASVYTLSETASDELAEALARRENAADAAGGLPLPTEDPAVARILISLVQRETQAGSASFARLLVAALERATPLLTQPYRQAAFAVLKAPDVPSVLVELGFLSHPEDEAALRDPRHRARLAQAIADAVSAWAARPGR